ncbi:MAG TPA: Asp-tRNA(Asn)/Glu-tRNA(Gln) amidotransferase subunit GatC [Vicinamibacterales bacterium]|nr:Asp-tRNA(Asn)/Glu-tRNA(Gln) amidotransferase subunit GatC [Vicinamibacterales bacterium]
MAEHLSEREVDRIAALARLALTGEERRRLASQLGEVLSFAGQIAALDTGDAAPADDWLGQFPVERPDEVERSLDAEAALANAPERFDDLFLTPRVLP